MNKYINTCNYTQEIFRIQCDLNKYVYLPLEWKYQIYFWVKLGPHILFEIVINQLKSCQTAVSYGKSFIYCRNNKLVVYIITLLIYDCEYLNNVFEFGIVLCFYISFRVYYLNREYQNK